MRGGVGEWWGEGDKWCALTAKNDHILTHITSRERMGERERGKWNNKNTKARWACEHPPSTDGIVQIIAVKLL